MKIEQKSSRATEQKQIKEYLLTIHSKGEK